VKVAQQTADKALANFVIDQIVRFCDFYEKTNTKIEHMENRYNLLIKTNMEKINHLETFTI
jgi:hypothetical protein